MWRLPRGITTRLTAGCTFVKLFGIYRELWRLTR